MDLATALDLINNQLIYRPGWSFTAHDHTRRFQGSVLVRVDYGAFNTNRDMARKDFPEWIETYASFSMVVTDCDETEFYRRLFANIMEIEEHENREFFRFRSLDYDAPFHPHRIAGMNAWLDTTAVGLRVAADLKFGVA